MQLICKHCGNIIVEIVKSDVIGILDAAWIRPKVKGLTRELRLWCFPLEDPATAAANYSLAVLIHEPYEAFETLALTARESLKDSLAPKSP